MPLWSQAAEDSVFEVDHGRVRTWSISRTMSRLRQHARQGDAAWHDDALTAAGRWSDPDGGARNRPE